MHRLDFASPHPPLLRAHDRSALVHLPRGLLRVGVDLPGNLTSAELFCAAHLPLTVRLAIVVELCTRLTLARMAKALVDVRGRRASKRVTGAGRLLVRVVVDDCPRVRCRRQGLARSVDAMDW